MNALVIGGRGALGSRVCAELEARGHRAIVARRGADFASASVPLIINCAGASVAVALGHGWRGYRAVDTPIGLQAVDAARRTGARLVYVGVHHGAGLRAC